MSQRETSIWSTPGLMEALRELSEMRVHSAATISRILSNKFKLPISRMAVIGKCFRGNIATRSRPRGAPTTPRSLKQGNAPNPQPRDPTEPTPKGDVPCGCRWVHGDARDRLFCGAPTTSISTSWCEYHGARVWSQGPGVKFQVRRAA